MSIDSDFYKWFNNIAPKLDQREISFRKVFKYLDSQPTSIISFVKFDYFFSYPKKRKLRKSKNFIWYLNDYD